MCWNYRQYGNSKKPKRCCLGFCDNMSPYNIKMDAEHVLNFLTEELKIKGSIGVYGRSLGGMATCHLANNF